VSCAPTHELVSLRELSRRTGLDPKTIRELRDRGGMPVYQITKRRQLVVLEEWWGWFREHRRPAPTRS
jgi:hypothetical protein